MWMWLVSHVVQQAQHEIDESVFGKRKYNKGHAVKETWVFGGVERTGKRRLFGEVVEDRTAKTLLEVIKRRVANGSIIYSDMWASYNGIEKELKMEHCSVNHTKYFKDPVTGVGLGHSRQILELP